MLSDYYNVVFNDGTIDRINIKVKFGTKIKIIIEEYLKRIRKSNLFVQNIDNLYFVCNAKVLNNKMDETLESIFNYIGFNFCIIDVLNGWENNYNYEIVETIKENVFTSVFKAKMKIRNDEFVAIKKIYKDKIKEEMKFSLCKEEITEEDFKPEIVKFNKELENMNMSM